jgi:hypothetical protein
MCCRARHRAEPAQRVGVQVPHGISNGLVVRVDDGAFDHAVPGQVDLAYERGRHSLQVDLRIEAMIDAVHVDIVQIEQDQAVGLSLPCSVDTTCATARACTGPANSMAAAAAATRAPDLLA